MKHPWQTGMRGHAPACMHLLPPLPLPHHPTLLLPPKHPLRGGQDSMHFLWFGGAGLVVALLLGAWRSRHDAAATFGISASSGA